MPGTLLVIGDGISPKTSADFKNYFATQNHQLLILGMGREASSKSEVESLEGPFIPLERSALEKLASEGGGFYQSMTLDKEDVKQLTRRINNYLVIVDDGSSPWVDAGYYLLYPFGLILLLWFRKGWTLHWCIALALVTSFTLPGPAMANDS